MQPEPSLTHPLPEADPFLHLEGVEDPAALAWAADRSAQAFQTLQAWPDFLPLRSALLEALDSPDRMPSLARRAGHFYNFWQDAQQPRGLWRRMPLEDLGQPDPRWEVLLDLDALGTTEGVGWTFAGARALPTDPDRCLVFLSRGGADAVSLREFDLRTRTFVADGFRLPDAKTDAEWLDPDTLLVGTDLGPGSLTDSGYPRQIRCWRRGTPIGQAPVVFEGMSQDVSVRAWVDATPGHERVLFNRTPDFHTSELSEWCKGEVVPLRKPADARLQLWRGQALMALRSEAVLGGQSFPAGALIAGPAHLVGASQQPGIESSGDDGRVPAAGPSGWHALFTPNETSALDGWICTRSAVVLQILDSVVGRLEAWSAPRSSRASWMQQEAVGEDLSTISVQALGDPMVADDPLAEAYALVRTGYLQPPRRVLRRVGQPGEQPLHALPAQFDASGLRVDRAFAVSADGTRVPYFVVGPDDDAVRGQAVPTLLYGYGGFEVSLTPGYSAGVGRGWLERGGRYVVANIRGGGEYGPRWHQAALREGRQRAFDDFAAVAEDLIRRGLCEPSQLGIMGGSNGGLLVGAVMLQRPERFGAVVCQVPLLDMRRYHRLLAGASWMAEYGDPDDPRDWAFIGRYSPYQNVPPAGQVKLPPILIVTSTRDDRVHPGHARKMVARLQALGHSVLYWENTEGGHGGAADNAQRAQLQALTWAFLWQRLHKPAARDLPGGGAA